MLNLYLSYSHDRTHTHTLPDKGDIAVYIKKDLSICPKEKESNKYKREAMSDNSEGLSHIKSKSGSAISGSLISNHNEHIDVLSLKCTWEKIHQLGISKLFIKSDTNFLITLSFDCTCKILDATVGNSIYNIQNSHNCMFMGVTWSLLGHFYLCDELGYLEVFSTQKERNVACLQLLQTGSERRTENILGEHRDPGMIKCSLDSIIISFCI